MSKFPLKLASYIFFCSCFIAGCKSKDRGDEAAKYSLTFTGKSFDVHGTQQVHMALFDRETRQVIKKDAMKIARGEFQFAISSILDGGHAYYLDFFVDMDEDGVCDDPPADHAWRAKIDAVTADVEVTEDHRFGFSDICTTFADTQTEDLTTLTVSGALTLSTEIQAPEDSGLTPGQTVQDATVFLRGFPDTETKSDGAGNFTLSVLVPEAESLTAADSEYTVVMWYTVRKPGADSTTWDTASARFGTKKVIEASSTNPTVNVGSLGLEYTKGIRLTVLNSQQSPVDQCWVRLSDFDFQIVVVGEGEGKYLIDYLPPDEYDITITCSGYEEKILTHTVGAATELGELEEVNVILTSI